MSTNQKSKKGNLTADIVVIGGGGAGLMAAAVAAEAGAKNIVILEKAASPGGNTAMAAGIFAVESPVQKRLGIRATRDEVFKGLMKNSRWLVDPRVVRAFVNKSGEVIQWLENKGMEFTSVNEIMPGGVPFAHMISTQNEGVHCGFRLIDTLTQSCRKESIQVLCETAAKKIILDEKGRVSGVLAGSKGREIKIDAKSAIIAAGGFGGNMEMLNKYFMSHGNVKGNTLPQMTGDGITMAEEAGASIDTNFAILLIGPNYSEGMNPLDLLVMRPDVMLVNKKGERYTDESLFLNYHNWSGNALNRQPDKISFALFDSAMKRHLINEKESLSRFFDTMGGNGAWLKTLEENLQKEAAAGRMFRAESLETLARQIGIDPRALKAAADQYNSFCDNGYDADFLKDKKFLLPLRTPPYYAVPGHQNFDTTLGGIRVNRNMEVVNKQFDPIGGLYAAGDNAGSWLSQNYDLTYPGVAMGFALCSGFIAGESAASYLKSRE